MTDEQKTEKAEDDEFVETGAPTPTDIANELTRATAPSYKVDDESDE